MPEILPPPSASSEIFLGNLAPSTETDFCAPRNNFIVKNLSVENPLLKNLPGNFNPAENSPWTVPLEHLYM